MIITYHNNNRVYEYELLGTSSSSSILYAYVEYVCILLYTSIV